MGKAGVLNNKRYSVGDIIDKSIFHRDSKPRALTMEVAETLHQVLLLRMDIKQVNSPGKCVCGEEGS